MTKKEAKRILERLEDYAKKHPDKVLQINVIPSAVGDLEGLSAKCGQCGRKTVLYNDRVGWRDRDPVMLSRFARYLQWVLYGTCPTKEFCTRPRGGLDFSGVSADHGLI